MALAESPVRRHVGHHQRRRRRQRIGRQVTRDSEGPGLAILVVQELVGLVAVGEPFGLGVPVEPLAGGQRDVRQVGEGGRAVALLDVGVGPLAALDAVEEVAGGLLIEIAVGRLDDQVLPPRLGVLERPPALGDDLEAPVGRDTRSRACPGARPRRRGRAPAGRWPRRC